MAKAKKQEKTIEQRLEEALVLYEKMPYTLPSSWCWTRLGTVCKLDNGIKNDNEELFYLDAKTLRTQNYEQTRRNGVVVEEGEKVILVDGENSGEVFDIHKRGYMGSTFRILNINKLVNEVYVRYFISSHQDELRNNKIGSAIPHLNKELFFNLIFPLAPLEEQKRIVEIIEKQFAKLDEARDLIQASLDSFADRKSAILHKAFTGELTKQWRNKNDYAFVKDKKSLFSATEKIGDGLHGTPQYSSNGEYYFINGNNFSGKSIEIKSDTKTVDYNEYKKYFIELNDRTVFLSINGTLGKVALYNNERVILGKSACYIIVKENILSKNFLRYYFLSKEFLDYAQSKATGSTIKNLGLKQIRNHEIWLPRIKEQEEIVRILDSIFEKEDKSKELLDMLDKIDEMKKSILARAFRGQLGTSNPTDEPAIDLLRKILEQSN